MDCKSMNFSRFDYEHECGRAELLGLTPPTWEEFCNERSTQEKEEETELPFVDESAIEIQEQGESLKRNAGGLDEINTILASTQIKINRFKSVCGSFSSLIRLKNWKANESNENSPSSSSVPATPIKVFDKSKSTKSDIEHEVADHIDRLDSLIGKAERAEMSMSAQNKQMKSFLK